MMMLLGTVDEIPPFAGTVPMTRSNSLPILTYRELDAMMEKDGELGLARGREFAWVSRDPGDETDDS